VGLLLAANLGCDAGGGPAGPAFSLNPIYDEDQLVNNDELLTGTWKFDGSPVEIRAVGNGAWSMKLDDLDAELRLASIGRFLVMDLTIATPADPTARELHLPCIVTLTAATLELACLSDDWVRQRPPEEMVAYEVRADGPLEVTLSGSELRDLLAIHGNDPKAFPVMFRLKRRNPRAVEAYRQAAQGGDPAAQEAVALAFLSGDDVERDPEEAFRWMSLAAEQGRASAQTRLGEMYAYGNGPDQDYDKALAWFQRSAEQEYAPALFNIGRMLEEGHGSAADPSTAATWYARAAALDYAPALYRLGSMFLFGKGVPQNEAQGVDFLRRSVKMDDAQPQAWNLLGWFHATSHDPAVRDPRTALQCARKAVTLSGGNNPDLLDTLAEAYAAMGKYRRAEAAERRALGLAVDEDARAYYEQRLTRFEWTVESPAP